MPAVKQPISEGVMARALSGLKSAVGAKMQGWFSPLAPVAPVVPKDGVLADSVRGRQLDFPAGYNIRQKPRSGEAVSFEQMRALADGCDVLRLVIETRKDQMASQSFSVRPIHDDAEPDARCKEVQDFFRVPDGENDYAAWQRMVLEDLFVLDAVAVYPWLTNDGSPYRFDLLAPETIKRVINEQGRTPAPPDPAYQQVLKGVPVMDYTVDELVYSMRNKRTNRIYGYSPVEQVIMTVNIALRRSLHQLQYYTEGSTPDLLFQVPADWNMDQIKDFQDWWDSKLAGNTAARAKGLFIPNGVNPVNTKDGVLKDPYDEWLARIVCYAFSVSPSPFVAQMNRATAESAQEAALMEGLHPIMQWMKGLLDRLIWKYFGYTDLHVVWDEDKVIDPQVQASINDTKLRNGSKTINECRAEDGDDPVKGGDVPLIYLPTGPVPLSKCIESGSAMMDAALKTAQTPPPPPVVAAPGEKPPAVGKPAAQQSGKTVEQPTVGKLDAAERIVKKKPTGSLIDDVAKGHEGQARDEQGRFASVPGSKGDVPAEPGSTPVKEGYVRLYHQTSEENLLSMAKNGLTIDHAKGIEGPRAVYASETGFYGTPGSRPTLEFQVPKDKFISPFVLQDVQPKDMVAAHLPWHDKARYLESKGNEKAKANALAGKFDDLTGDYAQAVSYIKTKYGTEKLEKRAMPRIDRCRKAVKVANNTIQTRYAKALKALAPKVAQQVATLRAKVGKADVSELQRILDALNLDDLVLLEGDMQDVFDTLVKDAGMEALAQLGIEDEGITDLVNEKAVAWAEEHAADLVTNIRESTREMLRADIADAMASGMSNDDLADELEDAYTFSENRAETIATTETAFADVQGNLLAYRESGQVAQKGWIVGAGCCELCDALDGEIIDLDEQFEYDGELIDGPPGHPRCRCDVVPIVSEDAPGDATDDDESAEKAVLPRAGDEAIAKVFNEDQPRAANGQWGSGEAYASNKDEMTSHTKKDGTKEWRDSKGKAATAAQNAQLKAAGISHGMKDVRLNPDSNGKILAMYKTEGSGKVQFKYSKETTAANADTKFARQSAIIAVGAKIDAGALKQMANTNLPQGMRDTAAVTYLMAQTGIRVGGEGNKTELRDKDGKGTGKFVPTYGATTLTAGMVSIKGDTTTFSFAGKGNHDQEQSITDKRLTAYVKEAVGRAGKGALFPYTDDSKVRAFVKQTSGMKDAKAHDLRGRVATNLATSLMAKYPTPKTAKEFKAQQNEIATRVSERLGNTRAMALKSYIHPDVWKKWSVK